MHTVLRTLCRRTVSARPLRRATSCCGPPLASAAAPAGWDPPEGVGAGISLRNSLTGGVEPLVVPVGKPLTWYSCGPTVYDAAHLGHARTYICLDILHRVVSIFLLPPSLCSGAPRAPCMPYMHAHHAASVPKLVYGRQPAILRGVGAITSPAHRPLRFGGGPGHQHHRHRRQNRRPRSRARNHGETAQPALGG
jgi:hypothetical protein